MNSKQISTKDILLQVLFLAIGVALLIFVLQKFNLDQIVSTLKNVKVWPICLVLVISLLGHLLRSWRWQLMMDTTGKSNFWNLLFSLQLGYFVSLAIPRIGEFIKCFTSAETEKKPVSFVFGTVMAERVIDFVIFAILLLLAFLFKGDFISEFWVSLKSNFQESNSGTNKYFMIAGIILVFVIIYPMVNKMTDGEKNELQLMDGLKSAINVKQKTAFWTSTILIWVCYFFTSYLLFFCFDATSSLSWVDGYLTMIGGTVSRMLPINGGGIGAYHFVTENLLSSLGIEKLIGVSYALLNHGIQFIFQIVVGVASVYFLSKKVDLKNISKIKF